MQAVNAAGRANVASINMRLAFFFMSPPRVLIDHSFLSFCVVC
jgi:hypothetical protein